ncbi:hypothetical protein HpVa147_25150 [Helicobacter pylori]
MSGLRTFSCVVVLCGAMVNVAIASPKIEASGSLSLSRTSQTNIENGYFKFFKKP